MKRRIMKEGSSGDREVIKNALDAAIKAKQLLDDAADTIRDAVGETFLFARLDSHSMDLDDTIDDIKAVLNGTVDATDDTVDDPDDFEHPFIESRKGFCRKFVRESDGETEWFDSNGDIKRHFPKDCILDCSGGGRVDDEVDYWVSELNFKVPVDRGLSYVREYGLDDIDPGEVDKYVLWIMCGNIKEDAREFCRDGSEWEYVDRESYPDEMDNWNDEDWDRFQEEACVCHLGM